MFWFSWCEKYNILYNLLSEVYTKTTSTLVTQNETTVRSVCAAAIPDAHMFVCQFVTSISAESSRSRTHTHKAYTNIPKPTIYLNSTWIKPTVIHTALHLSPQKEPRFRTNCVWPSRLGGGINLFQLDVFRVSLGSLYECLHVLLFDYEQSECLYPIHSGLFILLHLRPHLSNPLSSIIRNHSVPDNNYSSVFVTVLPLYFHGMAYFGKVLTVTNSGISVITFTW